MLNKTLNNYRRSNKKYLVDTNQPLILISQIQRSGGTLLSQLFDGHPELYSNPAEITWGYPTKYHFPNLQQYGDITIVAKLDNQVRGNYSIQEKSEE